ncbi:MAG TPA: Hsp20/alpha crystallin family protein [Dissulfurispiraceae bacterium]|nr:Hsp20/alpha crystallin family protein [Dissulfurispiraceae bacterium]
MTSTRELVRSERSRTISPFDEIERWFEDMWSRPSSLLASSLWPADRLTERGEFSPSVDMFIDGNELVLRADLPGVRKEDITIDIADTMLTISGEKKIEEKIEKDSCISFERSYGCFCRRFELPEGTDTDKVKAHLENGVLEVRIPKSENIESKTKKISIN